MEQNNTAGNTNLQNLEIRLSLNPWDAEAYVEKAMLLNSLGQEDEAYKCLDAALMVVGNVEDDFERKSIECIVYFVRARLDEKNGKTPISDLIKITNLSEEPEQVAYAYHMIGEYFLKKERFEEAEQAYNNSFLSHSDLDTLHMVVMIRSKRKD